MSDWLTHLTVERGLADHTLAAYRRDLRRYLEYAQAEGVDDPAGVTEDLVTGFLRDLRTGGPDRRPLAASSAARTLVAVRGLHKFLAAEGQTSHDPAQAVAPPTPPSRLPKAISVAEVERLLEAASLGDPPISLRDRALLEVLYGAGTRISEAVGLDLDDLDLGPGPGTGSGAGSGGGSGAAVARVVGKGSKQRLIPLGSYAVRALEEYLVRARPGLAARGSGTAALFLNQRGNRLSRQSAWGIIRTAADRAGLEHVSPHTLRHSFATHLLDGGADVRVVQELLGHASVTTTQIYTLVTVQQLREVYAQAHPRAR